MKTKKNYLVVIVLLITVIIVGFGCSNFQNSSMEEAKYVIEQLPEFKRHVQYFAISSGRSFSIPSDPCIYKSLPELFRETHGEGPDFVHMNIYENKNGLLCLALLNDSRPPKIIINKELK